MNIGILYPRSSVYASLGFEFLDGLKSFLKAASLDNRVIFTTESIGFGGMEKEIFEKAEKLLLIERVDVLLAYIDQRVMGILQPLFFASGKLIVVINPGANYPLNWIPPANVVQLTLQHSFLCWLTGAMTAEEKAKDAAFATSYYDGGYLHNTAMVKAFVKEGGNIVFNYVSNQAYDDTFEIGSLTGFLSANKNTDLVLAAFDAVPAALLYNRLNGASVTENLQLYVSAMMLEASALKELNDGYNFSIAGHIPWQLNKAGEANKKFSEIYKAYSKKEPSIFSLLGWEAGLVLEQVLLNDDTEGAAVIERLKSIKLDSPRGAMQLDADTQFFLAPVGRCSIPKGSYQMQLQWIDDYEKQWRAFVAEPTEGVISGWMNTYLCY